MIRNYIKAISRRINSRAVVFLLILLSLNILVFFHRLPAVAGQDPLEPVTMPDANNAFALYADRCANCHGATGGGDGQMAGNLQAPPRDFSDDAFRRVAVPATMFLTISDGRLEAGMPPFGSASSNPIAEADRWDLIAVVYSLGAPKETIENGRAIYEQNCQSCHGEDGAGDGPEAASSASVLPDLSGLRYWSNRSNEMVFASLQDASIADHTYDLAEEELWDVVDFSRTFSYVYGDPEEANKPIESVLITGDVINGTTAQTITGGTVTLRAFTPDLQEAATLETGVGDDGSFSFEVKDAGVDWVYMASIDYNGLNFSSNPQRLEQRNSPIEMTIAAYDTADDPSAINIDQVHLIMDVVDDRVQISEIYVLSNSESTVFIGESGSIEDGTFKLALPNGAENPTFQRSFRSFENFLPASEVIATGEEGYADTVAIRPGDAVMNLLASYELPFEEGMLIEHPVYYEAESATVVVPQGLEILGEDWTSQGAQQMGSVGTFLSYSRTGLESGEAIRFTLEGTPQAFSSVGSVPSTSDNTAGILLGGALLLVVAGGAVFTIRSWQNAAEAEGVDQSQQINVLLYKIAALDEAYEAGKIDTGKYEQQRAEALAEVAAIWQSAAR